MKIPSCRECDKRPVCVQLCPTISGRLKGIHLKGKPKVYQLNHGDLARESLRRWRRAGKPDPGIFSRDPFFTRRPEFDFNERGRKKALRHLKIESIDTASADEKCRSWGSKIYRESKLPEDEREIDMGIACQTYRAYLALGS